jgi:hypothetical protein
MHFGDPFDPFRQRDGAEVILPSCNKFPTMKSDD